MFSQRRNLGADSIRGRFGQCCFLLCIVAETMCVLSDVRPVCCLRHSPCLVYDAESGSSPTLAVACHVMFRCEARNNCRDLVSLQPVTEATSKKQAAASHDWRADSQHDRTGITTRRLEH
jgi:hypothetical protein